MPALAPASGSTQTYIWRDSGMMAQLAETLPVTVELMSEYSVEGGEFTNI